MANSYVERSYLNLDSDTEASLYTRNSRVNRVSVWDDSPPASIHKTRAVLASIGGRGLGGKIKERISSIPRDRLYVIIAIAVILILGGAGGGVAAGIMTKRDNSTTTVSRLDPTPASLSSTSVQTSSSSVSAEQQSSNSATSTIPDPTTSSEVLPSTSFSSFSSSSSSISSVTSSTSTPTITSDQTSTPSLHPLPFLTTPTLVASTTAPTFTTVWKPGCTTSPVLVTFSNIAETVPGSQVKVVGNTTALGNWNPVLAPTLYERYDGTLSLWTISLLLPAGQVVEYEFTIDEGNGTFLWQDNHVYTTTVDPCGSTAAPTVLGGPFGAVLGGASNPPAVSTSISQ